MTEIIMNQGLGIQNSSLNRLGSYGPKGKANLGQGGEKVYLNAANGNLILQQSEGFLASTGLGLELIHTYNSQGERGTNWCFNIQTKLVIKGSVNSSGSIVVRIDEDGHSSRFIFNVEKGYYVSENSKLASLKFKEKHWVYQEGSNTACSIYNENGQLTELSDQQGHQLKFKYIEGQLKKIQDLDQKQTIEWTFEKGVLQDIRTFSQGELIHHSHYVYDEQGRLQKSSRALGNSKIYWISYDYAADSNRITAIRQSDGTALFIDYDSMGRVKQLRDGEERTTNYEYLKFKTIVRSSLGELFSYCYDERGRLTGIENPNSKAIRYEYTDNDLSAIHQGSLHWSFNYNAAGDCIRIQDPSGQVKIRLFDSEHRLLSEKAYALFDERHPSLKYKTSHSIYDELGQMRFKIAADGTVTEYRFNKEGQCLTARTYLQTGYDRSELKEQPLELNDLSSWVNSQNPQAISLKSYHYDWRGLLDEEHLYTEVNLRGEGLSKNSIITRYHYDAAGRLLEKSVPKSEGFSRTTYLYDDLGRLIQRCDGLNHYELFEYDDSHQRIIETDARGLQKISYFDKSGLLLTTQYLSSKQKDYGRIHYHYDALGRLQSERNLDGNLTYYFYDNEGQIRAICNAVGQLTSYLYDDLGRLVQTVHYHETMDTKNWQNSLPHWNQLKPKIHQKDRISQSIYNKVNQIAYEIDSEGAVINFEYDVFGKLTKKTAYANKLNCSLREVLSFDAISIEKTAEDRINYYYYDSENRLKAHINGEGSAKSYCYDRAGHLIETIHYNNRISFPPACEWNEPQSSQKDIHYFSLFNAAGFKVADIDALGYVLTYGYNTSGLLTSKHSYSTALNPLILNKVNSQTILADLQLQEKTSDHWQHFFYDDKGQLIKQREQNGLTTIYRYDEKGLVLEKTTLDEKTKAQRSQRFRYDEMGRISQSLNAIGASKLQANASLSEEEMESIWLQYGLHYVYDQAGRLCSQTNSLNQTTRYFYNASGQLNYTVNADGEVQEFHYNSFNEIERSYQYAKRLKSNLANLTINELSNLLINLKDETIDECNQFEYNQLGLIVKKIKANKEQNKTLYNSFGEIAETKQVIDPMHQRINRYLYDHQGLIKQQINDFGGLNQVSQTNYDVFGRIETKFDARGQRTSFLLNKRGECISIENQSRNRKLINYDAFGRILTETDYSASKIINYFHYDDQKNTLILEHPGMNSKVQTEFNAFGDKIKFLDGRGAETQYCYDLNGKIVSIQAPENSSKVFEYDSEGNLLVQQNGANQLIRYSYDAKGRVLKKTVDPNGLALTTTFHYDGLGRQLEIREANGILKQFTYDNKGNLIKTCIDPQDLNLIRYFNYDNRGLLTQQIDINPQGKNKITAFDWDNLGRRKAEVIDPEGLKITTRYDYDLSDNLIKQTDSKNQATHFIYDEQNRLRYQIDARGVVTEHRYNLNGNEIETVVYFNRLSILEKYSEANISSSIKTDERDQYQFRDFDGLGRLISYFDALGYASKYQYDANGNRIHISRYAQALSLMELKAGKRTLPTEFGERNQYFAYDGLNQLIYQVDEGSYLTQFDYDDNGHVIAKIGYALPLSIATNNYSLKSIKENIQICSAKDQYTGYAYDAAGRLVYQINPEGSVINYAYDGLGNIITSHRYFTPINLLHLGSKNWQNQLQLHSQDRMTRFIFDSAGREVFRISPEGHVFERRYDALGNVIADRAHAVRISSSIQTEEDLAKLLAADQNGRETQYSYDLASRLIEKKDANQQKTSYRYDANNNVLNRRESHSAEWTYCYDEVNQLIEIHSPITKLMQPNGASDLRSIITRNVFDSFGNLVSRIHDAEGMKQVEVFVYDAKNRKIKTIYNQVLVNVASGQASALRQEQAENLSEEQLYNAFDELIACKDKANNWRYQVYKEKGQVLFSVNAEGAVTGFQYDAFGNISTKTAYANPISMGPNAPYSVHGIVEFLVPHLKDRIETYAYDRCNHLIEIKKTAEVSFNAKTKHYERLSPIIRMKYNVFGELCQNSVKRNEMDWALTAYYYDKEGQKTACFDAENYLSTFSYNEFGELVEQRDYANPVVQKDREQISIPETNSKDRHLVFRYDKLGRLISKTLKKVRYERIINQSNQFETQIGDLTTFFSYDAMGNLISTINPLGHSSYCYYNSLNQLIAKIGAEQNYGRAVSSYSYDGLGRLVETIHYAQSAQEADEFHYLVEESDKDIKTHSIFDNQGNLCTSIDGLSHEIYYSYDRNGKVQRSWQLLSQIDGSKRLVDKRYLYDKEGHLIQTLSFKNNGNLRTEDASYNVFGDLIAKGVNGNLTTRIEYDNLGRIRRSNLEGFYQIYLYDLTDKLTQTLTSSNAFSSEYGYEGVDLSNAIFDHTERFNEDQWLFGLQRQDNTYDGLGHCVQQRKEFVSETGQLEQSIQSQELDRWGNILSHISARGHETRYEYNVFNQIVKQEFPEVQILDDKFLSKRIKPTLYFAYDALGRSIAFKDAKGHILSKLLDSQGNILEEIDALGHRRIKTYDVLGRLMSSRNAVGGLTTYGYDQANRLIKIHSTGNKQDYVYDEAGKLLKQTNAYGQSELFYYDNLDNLVQKRDINNRLTSYAYDDEGHKVYLQDANGLNQTWLYDEKGRLRAHRDLGGHETIYQYNRNGLLIEENSSAGKNLSYRYLGNGQLYSYSDNKYDEIAYYSYDAEGRVLSKTLGRATQGNDSGWIKEMDYYVYDELGQLISLRRLHPDDFENRFPQKDNTLLNIHYFYDEMGNLSFSQVDANYSGYQKAHSDHYFSYDANNRLLINKGSLVNGALIINNSQGSKLSYDEAGNIIEACKLENNALQHYSYRYDINSRLETIHKNGNLLKALHYDALSRIDTEYLFDGFGHAAERIDLTYEGDQLKRQTLNTLFLGMWYEREKNEYYYDKAGNLIESISLSPLNNKLLRTTHHYFYEYWDDYLQSKDIVAFRINGKSPTFAQSNRYFDANGQLYKVIDQQINETGTTTNSIDYKISTFEGIHTRIDKKGKTNYLTISGKTIADLQLNHDGTQCLNVYGGFTPTGSSITQNAQAHFFSFVGAAEKETLSFSSQETQKTKKQNENSLINSPQENIGTYTVQAGDSLESIAFKIYGDSSLWYLLADANGISPHDDKQLHNGQRLIIPAVVAKQHSSSSSLENFGELFSAQVLLNYVQASAQPIERKSHSLFKKIIVDGISVIATLLAAAVCASLGGALGASLRGGLGKLLTLGMNALSGHLLRTLGSLATGFTAGAAGNLAGQGLARAMGLRKSIDLNDTLLSGLSSAASSGLLQILNSNSTYMNLLANLNKNSFANLNLVSAAEQMEQEIIGQGLSLATQKHHHLDWVELGLKGGLAAVAAGKFSEHFSQGLKEQFGEFGRTLIGSELRALTTGGIRSTMRGEHFNAKEVLSEHLGSALANSFVNTQIASAEIENSLSQQNPQDQFIEGPYCPILQNEDQNFTSIPEGSYERFKKERVDREFYESISHKLNELWNDYGEQAVAYAPKLLGLWEIGKEPEAEINNNGLSGISESAKNIFNRINAKTRLEGTLEALGGALEITAASTLIEGSAGLGTPLAYAIYTHGIDHLLTGTMKTISGESNNSLTQKLLQKASISKENAILADTGFSLLGSPLVAGAMLSKGALGAASGAFGSFVTGGDYYDYIASMGIGATVSVLGANNKMVSNHYVTGGLSNLAGQFYSKIRDPQKNHFSLIALGSSLIGSGMANFFTKEISYPVTKTMVDTMYAGFFNAMGNNLAKQKGW